MADLNKFAENIRKIGKRIEINADKSVIKLATRVQETVIRATPVDTGRARGNWFATLNTPTTKIEENNKDKSGNGAIAENTAVINRRKNDQSIYISNNLPYIKRLNEGYSEQAPAGFVEKAVNAAKSALRNEIRLLKK